MRIHKTLLATMLLSTIALSACSNHEKQQNDELAAYVQALAPFAKSVQETLDRIKAGGDLQDIYRAIIQTHDEISSVDLPSADNEPAWTLYERAKSVRTRVQMATQQGVESMASAHHDAEYDAATVQGVRDVIGTFQSAGNNFMRAYDLAKQSIKESH